MDSVPQKVTKADCNSSKRGDCGTALRQLPSALQLHIVSLLPPNDRALGARLACRDLSAQLSKPEHCTVYLPQPLPPHASPWAVAAGQQHVLRLPLRHKLQLLCVAAASGSELNLEVAWQLVQPSLFPGALNRTWDAATYPSPGVAAVEAGHCHLLGWLLQRCLGLLQPNRTLLTAAKHCHLDGLKAAWEALRRRCHDPAVQGMLDAAAESNTPDAVAKIEWMLGLAPEDCFLLESTAAAVARIGDFGRLQYLHRRGCRLTVTDEDEQEATLLASALEHADLALVRWLVDGARLRLPEADGEDDWAEALWGNLADAAAKGPDALLKLRWLEERGAPPLGSSSWSRLASLGIGFGRVELAEHVLSTLGPRVISKDAPRVAASAGSVTALDLLHKAGIHCTSGAYLAAACHGRVAAVRWLVREAGVSAAGLDLSGVVQSWPAKTQEDSRGLLEAVQLLVGKAGCTGWRAHQVVCAAARRGDLALVQYLLQQQQPGCQLPDWSVLVTAAEGGCEALLDCWRHSTLGA